MPLQDCLPLPPTSILHNTHMDAYMLISSFSFVYTYVLESFSHLPRLFAATIRSSLRPRAKWSLSYSASLATSTSSWRITLKVSYLLFSPALKWFLQSAIPLRCQLFCLAFGLTNTFWGFLSTKQIQIYQDHKALFWSLRQLCEQLSIRSRKICIYIHKAQHKCCQLRTVVLFL